MKHRINRTRLNRTSSHHKALLRNLAQSLIQHGQVRTTLPKAKDLRPFAERLITLAREARDGSVSARRRIHHLLSDRSFVDAERQSDYEDMSLAKRAKVLRSRSGRRHRTGQPKGKLAFTGRTIIHKLINDVAGKFEDRPGGYTRIVRLADRRIGDGSPLAVVQLVGEEESPGSVMRPQESARKRRADARYALAVKLAKSQRSRGRTEEDSSKEKEEAGEQADASGSVAEADDDASRSE